MIKDISSRERTLAAINHKEADRVPIFFRGIAPFDHLWKNQDRIDVLLKMGVDEKVYINIGASYHPDVTIRDWIDDESDKEYSLACREFNTPKGTLKLVMRRTSDCRYDNGVPLGGDHNVSRGVEFPIKSRDDLPKLACLLQEPTKNQIARFRERAKSVKEFAAERGIIVEGVGGLGGTTILHICGKDMYYIAQDDPGFLEELTEMLCKSELKCLEIVLEEGADLISSNGVYETAPVWSPDVYDKVFAPWVKKKADMAHQAGAKLNYFTEGLLAPHLDTLLDIGVDVVNGIQVGDHGNDMAFLKKEIGHRICLWGGINPHSSIEQNTLDETRRAVIQVIQETAQGGGFVLSTSGSIFKRDCYDNVITFIDTAHEFGTYPIDKARLEAELT